VNFTARDACIVASKGTRLSRKDSFNRVSDTHLSECALSLSSADLLINFNLIILHEPRSSELCSLRGLDHDLSIFEYF